MNFHPKDHDTEALTNDAIKGLLRSIGDSGEAPIDFQGYTLLGRLSDLKTHMIRRSTGAAKYGSSSGAPLTVTLDLSGSYGKTYVEVWVKSSAAADFVVSGSRSGVYWRQTDTISLPAAGEKVVLYHNAYSYIKVSTTAANDNEIEIITAA